MARFRRRFFRPECTFGAEALDDPVGLHSVSDDVPVGIGCGDLGKGESLAASGSARMTEQVTPLGGAGVLDAHRDRGGAGAPVEVVVRPSGGGTGGVHHRRDHPTVKVGAVIGEVGAKRESDHDVVGFVAFEHDAEPADERRPRHQLTHRLATFVLLLGGQRVGHGR